MSNLQNALGLPGIAEVLRRHGRARDSVLAHINPREVALLKKHGGAGTINPHTGILEFDDTGLTTGYFSGETAQPDYNLNLNAPTPGLTQSTFGNTPAPDVNYNLNLDGGSSGGGTSSFSTSNADAGGGSAGSTDTPLNFAGLTGSAPTGAGLTPTFNPGPVPTPATTPATTTDSSGLGGLINSGEQFAKNNKDLLSLGGALGLGAFNMHKANAEGAAAENKIKALAAPYRTQANTALAGAASGALTPAMQQQLQGLRAQANQNLSNNGQGSGVAAQQAAANIQQQAALFQQQLMTQGLQLAGVADQLTLEAINTGYQSDQAAQKAANGFFTAIFQAIGKAGK